ncbi:cytochrome P450 [Xylaria arbuscula]|nr:cytochrome P450 [Xylaria arbuscula]
MELNTSFILCIGFFIFSVAIYFGHVSVPGLRDRHLPPGPFPLPFLGNILSIPRKGVKFRFTQWSSTYGPIFSLKVLHGNMIVVNSAAYAIELFTKRSANYCNRPPFYVIDQLVFSGDHTMLMNADSRWRLRRKLYFQLMNSSACDSKHLALIEAETTQTLRDLIADSADLMLHPGRMSNSIIMTLVFGIRTPRSDTPHYRELRKIMTELAGLGDVGATPPVDLLPILKYLPDCFWGNWKSRAGQLRKAMLDLYHPLVGSVIDRRRQLTVSRNSFLDQVLDQQETLNFTRNEIDVMCGNLIEGGTDTVSTALLAFFQAMVTHPEVQKEAQDQIDSVVKNTRQPSWNDYERLPYIVAIIKEVLRWRPPTSIAFPYASSNEDNMNNMKIPRGSTMLLNIWGIHHDPDRYPYPKLFMPSRFYNQPHPASAYANSHSPHGRDHFSYGAGRRLCPGIHLSERILFVFVSQLLWACTIEHKRDKNGSQIPVDVDPRTGYIDGAINECHPFTVTFTPRSTWRRDMVFASATQAETTVLNSYD